MKRQFFLVSAFVGTLVLLSCGESSQQGSAEVKKPALRGPRAYAYGLERLEEGNYFGALYKFEQAIKEDPGFVDAYRQLGIVCAELGRRDRDYFERGEEVYAALRTLIPEDDLQLIKDEGRLKIRMGMADEAVATYEEALRREPENCELWILYGNGLVAKGMELRGNFGVEAETEQLREALSTFYSAIELCPNNFDGYYGVAIIMYQLKRYGDVEKMYTELREKHPESVEVLRQYTLAHFRSRKWDTAAAGFEELLGKDPTPEERLSYVAVLRKLERFDDAEEQLRIHSETAPKLAGPPELTKTQILRDELGIRTSAEEAAALMEKGKYDDALVVWRDMKARVTARWDDPEFEDATRELSVWVERRIRHTKNLRDGGE